MELAQLHAKFTADNSDLAATTNQTIGLIDQYGRALTKTAVAEDAAAKAAKNTANAYNRLRMQYDSAYASASRYEKAAALIKKTADQQKWSQERLNHELQLAARHYNIAEGAAENMNRAIRTSRFHTANLSAQFFDVGVMMASGQSPFMTGIQQGTQFTQVLQAMGGTAKESLGALWVALKAVISPMTLLTIGAIAGVSALYQLGRRAFESSEDIDQLAEAVQRVDDKVASVNLKYAAWLQNLKDTDEYLLRQDIARIQEELAAAIDAANAADVEAYGILQLRVGELQRELTMQQNRLAGLTESRDLEKEMEKAARETRDLTAAFVNYLDQAIIRAETLRGVMQQTADATARLAEMAFEFSAGGRAMAAYGSRAPGGTDAQNALADRYAPKSSGKPSSGGGGATTNPIIGQLEQLQQSLLTQEELQIESFGRQQETLKAALDQQLITRQEYLALMEDLQAQHASKMTAIDAYRYGGTLDKTEAFLGDMASAFQQGNAKMLQIAKVFGAAQAFISTMQGAAEALKLPFPANIAAAAQVVATGAGFVAAIKGVGSSGGGTSALGAASSAPAAAATSRRQVVDLQVIGGGSVLDDLIVGALRDKLAPIINEITADGGLVRVV